jgi:hypothetical protein
MTKLYTFLFLICFSSLYSQKTFLRENFNYPAGALLNANGWYAHSAGTTSPIAVTAEGYPGQSHLISAVEKAGQQP